MECQELVSKNQDEKKSTILIEKKRGLVHVRFSGNPIILEPSWSTDGWESIFIGKDNDLFHNVIDLVDIYRVGPYVSLFFDEQDCHLIRYAHLPVVGTALELSLLSDLANDYRCSISPVIGHRESVTQQLERVITDISNQIKEQIPEIKENTRTRLAQIAAYRTNILGRIFPILL
ncbi:MAG: hypothetical protein KAJ36_07650, partial [Candidatus Thorarchaeota archaeon]|nr:hypothetical protein [Candidatus Thorarchaeota archaeon]